ncbi:MAG: phosphatidate cytidylyltransferase [Pseudomonadota bacterium]|nr:phosphatidate cytidylyltransferase [Pseudomonadota bacterium]
MTSSQPARRAFDWRNLGVRLASAALLIPLAVLSVGFGGWLYLLTISVAVSLLAIEWGGMAAPRTPIRTAVAVTAASLAGIFATRFISYPQAWLVLLAGAALTTVGFRNLTRRLTDVSAGVIYIGGPCLSLMWLRDGPAGLQWTALLLAATWSADTAAFLVGNLLKGPKLQPALSPKKTWSGLLGGLAGGTAAAAAAPALAPAVFDVGLSPMWLALTGLLIAAATMAGDLWESFLKRRFGVKDSGDLIPGHGGLLDRVDGLLFAVLAAAAARLAAQAG